VTGVALQAVLRLRVVALVAATRLRLVHLETQVRHDLGLLLVEMSMMRAAPTGDAGS
jgi:hypothetical protein